MIDKDVLPAANGIENTPTTGILLEYRDAHAPGMAELIVCRDDVYRVAKDFHDHHEVVFARNAVDYRNGEDFPQDGVPLRLTDDEGRNVVPSYHNWNHISGALACWADIFREYSRGNDMFGLERQIKNYKELLGDEYKKNRARWNEFFSTQEWVVAMEIAWACHDLGNLTDTDELDEERLDHADTYVAAGAEERSKAITRKLVATRLPEYERLDQMRHFIDRMIDHTVFDPKMDVATMNRKPFWFLMQAIDQIGSTYYSEQAYALSLAGLQNEMRANRTSLHIIDASDILYFPFRRLLRLVQKSVKIIDNETLTKPDVEQYNRLVSLWSARRPKKADDIARVCEAGLHLRPAYARDDSIVHLAAAA